MSGSVPAPPKQCSAVAKGVSFGDSWIYLGFLALPFFAFNKMKFHLEKVKSYV